MRRSYSIALVGNPNCGKTSLFNALTGLNQRVGNFAGVTVDKKTGRTQLPSGEEVQIIDLPGTYSLYPKSNDEQVVFDVLLDCANPDRPDMAVVIADAAALKRNLLLCTQIMDLGIPVVLGLTMIDIAANKGITIDVPELQRQLGIPVIALNPRKNKGIGQLKKALEDVHSGKYPSLRKDFIDIEQLCGSWIITASEIAGCATLYGAMQICCQLPEVSFLNAAQRIQLAALMGESKFHKSRIQAEEVLLRYRNISEILKKSLHEDTPRQKSLRSERIDRILLHPLWGNLVLLTVLFLLFQSIFSLSAYPMDWVEGAFGHLGGWLSDILPQGLLSDLLINGVLAGISGVAVFIPQIMILFGLITILEDSGYMARISFLSDRLMRSVGLNGRSVMPLISGMACAVPAIMAARTIQNKKERLITILITPLMSCSARLPVYTILIGLVIPEQKILGIFNLQGLVLMGLYMLGFVVALIVAKISNLFIRVKEKTFFLMELPVYRAPRWKNVGVTMLEKAQIFVRDAGKVILIISIILWGLSTFGPSEQMKAIDQKYETLKRLRPTEVARLNADMATEKLANSYAGKLGHSIEPVIRPLGYDWRIGIALITSFAAREVFVGTMATLYSVGDTDNPDASLRDKMRAAKKADGSPMYTLGTGVSLLLFYVFALQCMSTLAITKRETGSWKYPVIQFLYMGVLAYLFAFGAYALLS
ncbi:ferrous iron transport protein B [Rurimicrobium arvi]|uniref:Ferrous iron transport protein B n=1 Tax=Rurimicrobium arvi TaxID=2049916 RepID=A0ABP8MGN6_9BACT